MIKWFDSKNMTGLPELTNTQGDLVKILTGLLVNGVNSKPITTVSYTNGVCTLTLGANHGFVRHSVIDIQNSLQAGFIGKEFRVKSLSLTTVSFDCPVAVTVETGLTVRYAPLGWTQHFASEGRSCYKSSDPRYPAYLRVDDTRFGGTEVGAAKFAGVEICADMTDFNTATWQSPYNGNYPLQNRGFIPGRSNGWFKWYYSSGYWVSPDQSNSGVGTRHYMVCGDSTSFWLVLYPYMGAEKERASVVGMPLITVKNGLKQCLVATSSFGLTGSGYPHKSFISSELNSVAPYLAGIGKSITGFPSPVISHVIDGMMLQSPIFMKDDGSIGMLTGQFERIGVLPSKLVDTSIVKVQNKLFQISDTGEVGYSIALDVGES